MSMCPTLQTHCSSEVHWQTAAKFWRSVQKIILLGQSTCAWKVKQWASYIVSTAQGQGWKHCGILADTRVKLRVCCLSTPHSGCKHNILWDRKIRHTLARLPDLAKEFVFNSRPEKRRLVLRRNKEAREEEETCLDSGIQKRRRRPIGPSCPWLHIW